MLDDKWINQEVGSAFAAACSREVPYIVFEETIIKNVHDRIKRWHPEENPYQYTKLIEQGIYRRIARDFGLEYREDGEDQSASPSFTTIDGIDMTVRQDDPQ